VREWPFQIIFNAHFACVSTSIVKANENVAIVAKGKKTCKKGANDFQKMPTI